MYILRKLKKQNNMLKYVKQTKKEKSAKEQYIHDVHTDEGGMVSKNWLFFMNVING